MTVCVHTCRLQQPAEPPGLGLLRPAVVAACRQPVRCSSPSSTTPMEWAAPLMSPTACAGRHPGDCNGRADPGHGAGRGRAPAQRCLLLCRQDLHLTGINVVFLHPHAKLPCWPHDHPSTAAPKVSDADRVPCMLRPAGLPLRPHNALHRLWPRLQYRHLRNQCASCAPPCLAPSCCMIHCGACLFPVHICEYAWRPSV